MCVARAYFPFILHSVLVFSSDYYCNTTKDAVVSIDGDSDGDIYTRYQGQQFYQNNQNCVWVIDAGVGNRVEISVNSSELQWAPESAICSGYDHVAIKDVISPTKKTSESDIEEEEWSIILQWCGHTQPLGAMSSGRYVLVKFMSDKNNPYNYRGIHLHFKIFSATACAPSWVTGPTQFCYKILDKKQDWSYSQRECNTWYANLASFVSEEYTFLMQKFGTQRERLWIGLNDIANPGAFEWIDDNQLSSLTSEYAPSPHEFFHCVTTSLDDKKWQVQDCRTSTMKPICKTNRDSVTKRFLIPQERLEDDKITTSTIIAIAVSCTIVTTIVIIIISCIIRMKISEKRERDNTAGHSSAMARRVAPEEVLMSVRPATVDCGSRTTRSSEYLRPAPSLEDGNRTEAMINQASQFPPPPPTYEEAVATPVWL